ncbi:mucin-5AC isoform X2 [Brienomyrus brachyistius]|nr:mucin-5AC isoform X2 [Brienomyrus brachyistius]
MKQSPVSVFLSLSYLFAFSASVSDFTLSQPHNRHKTPPATELTAVNQTDSLRHHVTTVSTRALAETATPGIRNSTPTWTPTSDSGRSSSGWRRETGVENRLTTADRTPRSSTGVWSIGSTPEDNSYSTASGNAQTGTNRNQADDDRLTEPSTVFSESAGTPINEHRANSDGYSSSTEAPSKRPNTSINRGTKSQTDVNTNAHTVTQTSSQEVWRAGSTPEDNTYGTALGNAQARTNRNQADDDRLTEPSTVYSESAGTPINEHRANSDGYSSGTEAPSKRLNTSINRGTKSQTDVNTNAHTVTQASSPGGSTTDSGLITSSAVTHGNQSACQSEAGRTLSSPRSTKLGCLIMLWVLSMIASVFFGLTVFLWVRLSFLRSRKTPRRSQCGTEECGVGVLWTQPRASIEERVERWYTNGSSTSPRSREGVRRKDRDDERQKRRQAGEVWERPRITPEDLQEFWADRGRMRWNKQCDEL